MVLSAFDAWCNLLLGKGGSDTGFEGGVSNDPADAGGLTNRGVTFATYRKHAAKFGLDRTRDGLLKLTIANAKKFARLYWDDIQADKMHPAISILVSDWYYNSGNYGVKGVQSLVSVTADGVIGPITLAAINAQDPAKLAMRIKEARANWFRLIVKNNESQRKFLAGWLRRNDEMYNEAIKFL